MGYGNSQYSGSTPYGGGTGARIKGPRVIPQYPISGQTDAHPDRPISLVISEINLDINSVLIEIDLGEDGFEIVFNYGALNKFSYGWDGPLSMVSVNGGIHRIVIDPWVSLPVNREINVRVTAYDTEGNGAILA